MRGLWATMWTEGMTPVAHGHPFFLKASRPIGNPREHGATGLVAGDSSCFKTTVGYSSAEEKLFSVSFFVLLGTSAS
jgi:hypothetical protein